jgi:hypothetical protein
MKRVLPILGITAVAVILFTSCGNKQSPEQLASVTVDTTGLAQFESWKKQQEFAAQYAAYQAEMEKKTPKATTSRSVAPKKYNKTGSMSTSTSYPAKTVEKKKGWSRAAKGAVIGGASGAVLGAVISKKNRALGAVIGGVAGAGAGYGIGRHLDKKAAEK